MKKLIYIFSFLILSSSAYAQDIDFTAGFSTIGRFLSDIMQNEYAVFGLTVVFSFLLIYSILVAALKNVKLFEGDGGLGVNKAGKMLAVAVSGISTVSFFTAFKAQTINFVPNFLGGFGLYSAFLVGIVLFLLIFRSFKDTKVMGLHRWIPSLFIVGIFMWLAGAAAGSGVLVFLGMLCIIVAIIGLIASFTKKIGFKRFKKDAAKEGHAEEETKKLQASSKDLDREIEKMDSKIGSLAQIVEELKDLCKKA